MKSARKNMKFPLIVLGALLLLTALVGCISFPEPVTTEEFATAARSLSFEIRKRPLDEIERLAAAGVTETFAVSHGTATVVFEVCNNDGNARRVFDTYSDEVENFLRHPTSQWTGTAPTWNSHRRRASGNLAVAIRVENTVFFATAETAEDIAAVDALIEAIDY